MYLLLSRLRVTEEKGIFEYNDILHHTSHCGISIVLTFACGHGGKRKQYVTFFFLENGENNHLNSKISRYRWTRP